MDFNKKRKKPVINQVSELIQIKHKPSNYLQIENLVFSDMKKKILNDEQNTLQFYDIVQPDQDEMIKSLKDSAKKPIRLHKKVKRSDLEQQLRSKLQEEPGSLLLLQEIYEKFEEQKEDGTVKRKNSGDQEQFKSGQQYIPQSDEQLVSNLDLWYKNVKKKMKEQKAKLLEEQEKEKEAKLAMMVKTQSLQNFRRGTISMDRNSARRSTMGMMTPAFPKLQDQALATISEKKVNANEDEKGSPSVFKQKMLNSLAKLSVRKKNEMLDQDSSLTKKLDKYMNQGSALTQQDIQKIEEVRANQKQQKEENDTLIFDYTVEGLKRSLHTLVKMQITTFHDANDRALFYEKQTNSILLSIQNKIDKQKKQFEKNDKDLQTLRLENHEIIERLRGIENLLKELQEELKHVNSPRNKQPSQSYTNLGSAKGMSSNVDNYMVVAVRQNEIEEQMDTMKDSKNKFSRQMKLNQVQIQKLESENQKLNKSNKALTKALQGFLLELLNIGLDCRKSGLCWVIKQIWDSGEKLSDQYFPPFLDSKARDFLVLKTRKLAELNKLFYESHQLLTNFHVKEMKEMNETANNTIISFLGKNHFSQIDSKDIKHQNIAQKQQQQQKELKLLFSGLTNKEKQYIGKSIHELYAGKETQNDIIYNEAQKRISKMFKTQQEWGSSNNQTTIPQEQSITIQDFNVEAKEKLIQQYATLQKDIENKEHQFKKFEDAELLRLVKEIDYKKYLQRFNVEALQVMAALFGYQRAERELIKNGMMRVK